MSQNDFTIANQGFPAFRSDLNSALQALASNNSGATAPSTTFANMWWYDSANNILYIRNEDNDAWIQFATLDQTNDLFVVTSSIDVGDNVKAKFGDGDDLEIYHDGTNSYIDDAGTGGLNIRGASYINLQKYTGETMALFNADGAVELRHNNETKFATTSTGIQVTGTALATTDTDTTNTGSVTLDFQANQNFVLTLTGNVTLANPTTEQVGQSGFITFIQDGTGGRTVSLGTDYETAGGAGLTLSSTASATDVVPYIVVASNRILLGTPQLAFS
jgi:hypothetical protein